METVRITQKYSVLVLKSLFGFALLISTAQTAMAVTATQLTTLELYNRDDDMGSYYSHSKSYPESFTDVNGTIFFTQDNAFSGRELWKTDGTEAGTVLVKDIYPGANSSSPGHFTNVNGTLFFTATTSTKGRELWKSDGTEAGTVLVNDIYPGSKGSFNQYHQPYELPTNVNGTLFFAANRTSAGVELWKSDGTEAGTVLIKFFERGTSYSSLTELTNVNGTVYFIAYTSAAGYELWKTDGTEAGTVLIKDINPGTAYSY
ncbi:MAG: hypothetical protein OEZ15_09620, partial [Gammaproteobacteria bacterium]|nr:hypothetical protein [Gammaproteobacteria bacterium]